MLKSAALIMLALLLQGCGDECSSYSEFSCDTIQNARYNVYFSFTESDTTYLLGEAAGLNSCGNVAYSYAEEKNLSDSNDWSYVCCMIAKGSSCYEKHR